MSSSAFAFVGDMRGDGVALARFARSRGGAGRCTLGETADAEVGMTRCTPAWGGEAGVIGGATRAIGEVGGRGEEVGGRRGVARRER
jgi:hypothetical protein